MRVTDLFLNETNYTVMTDKLDVSYIFGKAGGTKTTLFQTADDKAEARKLHDDCVAGLLKRGYKELVPAGSGKAWSTKPVHVMTAEDRSAAAKKAWETMRANGTKPAAKEKVAKVITAEDRSEAAKRAWVTIRANREAALKLEKAEARAAKKAAKQIAVAA